MRACSANNSVSRHMFIVYVYKTIRPFCSCVSVSVCVYVFVLFYVFMFYVGLLIMRLCFMSDIVF